MSPLTLVPKDDSWLEAHAREWVEAGLISTEQADGIKRHEHVGEAAPPQRLTLVTEVASYVGSVLALMGGAAVVGQMWDQLALLGRLAVALGIMAVGFTAGTWLMRLGEAGSRRLGSFLWAVGTGGVGTGVFAVMMAIDPNNGAAAALAVGAAVLAVSLALWRNLARPLQLLTAAIGFGISLGGLADLTDAEAWMASIVLMGVGFVLAGGAALRKVHPRLLALSIGSIAAYIGGFVLTDANEHAGPATALAVAVLVVAFALWERLVPLLVLGVIGSLIATQALLATTFTGAVSAVVVTVLGLVIVVVAIARAVRKPPRPTGAAHPV